MRDCKSYCKSSIIYIRFILIHYTAIAVLLTVFIYSIGNADSNIWGDVCGVKIKSCGHIVGQEVKQIK